MQSLPTEAGPLSHCSQCGKSVPRPTGSPTFVYGVGAVGYQSCAACGAKWRYLWQETVATPSRSRPPYAVIGGLLVVLIVGVVAVVALRGSATKYDATPSTVTTPPDATSRGATSAPTETTTGTTAQAAADGDEYEAIIQGTNDAKTKFLKRVFASGRATPQFEVNQDVTEFVSAARQSVDELADKTWPTAAASEVEDLVRAYTGFLADVDLLRYSSFLYSDSFFDKLRTESQAVRDAATEARSALGLPTVP